MSLNKILSFLFFLISHAVFAENLYHIVDRNDWEQISDHQEYRPNSLLKDGFIHLSTKGQVLETAGIFFKGKHNLLLLELDIPSNDKNLKWESPVFGAQSRKELFPHYYGGLPLTYVMKVYIFEPNQDSSFSFPMATLEK